MRIHLSEVAELKIKLLFFNVKSEWGVASELRLVNKFKKVLSRISDQPYSCRKIEDEIENVYKCVVSEQTSLFYRIGSDAIEVLTISDNRQNPSQIIEELKSLL